MTVAPFARTLDQELAALLRGASLECLVCGEFVLHVATPEAPGGSTAVVACPECRSLLADGVAVPAVDLPRIGSARSGRSG